MPVYRRRRHHVLGKALFNFFFDDAFTKAYFVNDSLANPYSYVDE